MENRASYSGSSAAADESARQSNLSEQLADITAKVLRFTSAGGAAIALVSGDVAVTKASSGDLAPDLDSRLRLQGSFAGLAIQKSELLYCEDAENDERVDAAASAALGLRSMVMVPIGEKGASRGVLAAFSAVPNGFRPTHIAVMRTLADIVHELLVREEHTRPSTEAAKPFSPAPTPAVSEFPIANETPKIAAAETPTPTSEIPVERASLSMSAPVIEIPKPVMEPSIPPITQRAAPAVKPAFEAPAAKVDAKPPLIEPAERKSNAPGQDTGTILPRPSFGEESRKEKDSLPSIISLVNQQKLAASLSPTAQGEVVVPPAEPIVPATPTMSTSGAAAKAAPVGKPLVKPVKPSVAAKPEPATAKAPSRSDEAPMFRGLEEPAAASTQGKKIGIFVAIGILVLAGVGFGVRSIMHRSAAPAAVTAAAETPVQTATDAAQAPPTSTTQTPQHAATTPTKETAKAAPKQQEEEDSVETRQVDKQKPVIVANAVSALPRRAEQADAPPQVSLGPKADMGALLASKTATPTLTVKRSVLSPPEVIRRVPPKFPDFARRTNPNGDRVVLNVTVNAEGKVKNVQIVRGQTVFAESAVNAVKQWQYRPAFLNGEAVEATVEVVVSFTNGR